MDTIPPKTNRILIVDDDIIIRKVVSQMITILGFEAISAQDGFEALNLFETNQFDMVITDFEMPGIDGFTLASTIKDKAGDIPIIMITGNTDEILPKLTDDKFIDYLLSKPFIFEDIKAAIGGLLDLNTVNATNMTAG